MTSAEQDQPRACFGLSSLHSHPLGSRIDDCPECDETQERTPATHRAVTLTEEEAQRSPNRVRYLLLAHGEALHDDAHRRRIADRSAREAIIRDLYALVAFYVAHPQHPLPDYMQIGHEVETQQHLEDLAAAFGTHTYGRDEKRQMSHRLPDASTRITLIVTRPVADRPL